MAIIAAINEFSIEAIRDALQKLESFDNLIINGFTAYQLNEIEKIDPELFAEICKNIKADRWHPSAGLWNYNDCCISKSRLVRHILYSSDYFLKKFGKTYKVFHCKEIISNSFAQIVYLGGFNAAVIENESRRFCLNSRDESRILIAGEKSFETVDINEIDDDYIKNADFTSFEIAALGILNEHNDIDIINLSVNESEPTENEKLLLTCEKNSTADNNDMRAEIKSAWISIMNSDDDVITDSVKAFACTDTFNEKYLTVSDGTEICAYKFSEDNSGDRVLRIKEVQGTEKSITVMCNSINAGFKCEILPYEMQTFRIDKDGFVTETLITE